ncbi:galactose-1-phosphate uridylyltransferase [Ignisphaera sp. 4213-co]|uniref:Galactose-1-phosphate uridylyltransferase n=1 Tax=Ignisphaera cupida TaxID=3050454 RepID=A0ABD4Z783_9CREN|nr:galactose-1-phosphate uridylyltransferase [Ignisphaera sp. 4213-co]MDK6027983.1 galactose-1-phosphate uridylyltransferase [Ignisphaera sp. 4213-co]
MSNSEELVMELRWDPTLGEWIMVSNIRSARPWQPTSFCPFCPGTPETGYGWKALILENRFPMLIENPPNPSIHRFYKTAKASGKCYVVVETPQHDLDDLSDLPLEQIKYVIELVIEKQKEEMKKDYAEYFLWFRNKGREIGVSLTHPHSQIYVTPFTPIRVLREIENAKIYWEKNRRCLFCDILKVEVEDKTRLLLENTNWVAFMPFYSHWPFEIHIYPKKHIQLLTQLSEVDIVDLAKILKHSLCGLKKLFSKPMPYIMAVHQSPLKGDCSFYHLHIEIYGILRDENKLKYAAGMETGGGNFTYDSVPELNAQKLKKKIIECLNENSL